MLRNEPIMLKYENPENGRYYYLAVYKDILDDYVLTVIRGGHLRGVRSRVVRHFGYACRMALQKELDRLSKKRIARGYRLVN